MSRWIAALAAALLLLAACTPDAPSPTPEAEPDAAELLAEVVTNLREVQTFRLLIEQTGASYVFYVSLDEGATVVGAVMRRGEAQYERPDVMYANVNLRIGGLPAINVELFARGANQWFKLAGSNWINFPIAEGFDPGALIQEDRGFSAALSKLRSIEYLGRETLVDGTPVYHVRGVADGSVVNELLFDLLSLTQEVTIDVYISEAQRLPALLVVTIPDTATEAEPEDTQWRIEVYDVNAPAAFSAPDEAARP